jgi:hypothetical protein
MSDSYEKLIRRRASFWSDADNAQKMLDRLRTQFRERHKTRAHFVTSLEIDKTLASLSTVQRRSLYEVAKQNGFRSVSAYLRYLDQQEKEP